MNADSSADVDVRGDASATLPMPPWLAGGLLVAATASGVVGGWILRTGPPPTSPRIVTGGGTMQTMKEAASEFLAHHRIAVTGVSRSPRTTDPTPCTSVCGTGGTTCSRSIPTPTRSRVTPAITI